MKLVNVIGPLDGFNSIFTLSSAPIDGAIVVVDGLVKTPGGDYGISGNILSFTAENVPESTSTVSVWVF